jgi:hypothetical protein
LKISLAGLNAVTRGSLGLFMQIAGYETTPDGTAGDDVQPDRKSVV